MKKEELKEWFWYRFNSCYRIEHHKIKGNYLFYYNKAYNRKKKIQSLLGNEIEEIYPTEKLSDSKILFYLDYKNGWFNCDYEEIWSFFEENYSSNDLEIRDLIKGLLEEYTKLRSLTPYPKKYYEYL